MFGSLIKQYSLKQDASQADWLIGAGLLAAGVKGVALRSMKAPGTAYDDPVLGRDPQPAHMKDYIHTTDDNGGVHLNSGIPNHAFYLAAIAIGGNAWEAAGRIWYETLRDPKLKANANFSAFAKLTVKTAGRLYKARARKRRRSRKRGSRWGCCDGLRERQRARCELNSRSMAASPTFPAWRNRSFWMARNSTARCWPKLRRLCRRGVAAPNRGAEPPSATLPDARRYRLTLEIDGEMHEITAADPISEPAIAELIDSSRARGGR